LTTKIRQHSTDIVRTKSFDSSAKLLNPSLSYAVHTTGATAYRNIDPNNYFSPFDRIARLYSPNASNLTMKEAAKLGKMVGTADKKAPPKLVGVNLSATAPDAFDAISRIQGLALTGGPRKKRLESLDTSASMDAGAMREHHRMLRSKPGYDVLVPRKLTDFGDAPEKNFDNWNPESIHTAALEQDAEDSTSAVAKLKLFDERHRSTGGFHRNVEYIAEHGIITATGSGHRAPVCGIKQENIESIVARVPSIPGFLDDEHMRYCLSQELNSVRQSYLTAGATASVAYTVKDATLAAEMGIDNAALFDSSATDLWTNRMYQLPEWRVLRQTGVDSRGILQNFHRIDHTLCNTLPIMLELQYLWMDGSLPTMVWEEQIPSMQRCTYSNFMFVDVNQNKFRARLPFMLDEFAVHVESLAKEVRDALETNWVIAAASKLSAFVNHLPTHTASHVQDDSTDRMVSDFHLLNVDDGDEASLEESSVGSSHFKRFKEKNVRKTMRARAQLEGLSKKPHGKSGAHGTAASVTPKRKSNRAEKTVDCAVVLMSRQLRGMCESSLLALTELFEKLSRPHTASYSIFVINVRLRKVKTKEITSDFADPLEVCLQPDMSEIQHTMSNVINVIVNASRGYERPEQLTALKGTFGGKNHNMIKEMQSAGQFKKMNECSVALTDAIVVDVKRRIHAKIAEYFAAPASLLEKFSVLDKLFSGAQCDQVMATIRTCIGAEDTLDSLEKLGVISKELEVMVEAIKTKVPDVSHYPMFEVRCIDLKDLLIRQCRFLHAQIMDAIVEENRNHMANICQTYQDITTTMSADITDSAELKALQDFVNKSATTLADLHDQYVLVCVERIRFLLNHKHKFGRDDMSALNTTYNWPMHIQSILRRAYESLSSRKKELEELLEEDQRRLENDVNDIYKRVETLADNSNPMDFRKNVERVINYKRDLEAKTEKAEELHEREALLEVPHSDFGSRLEEIKVNLEPLERLWVTVKAFVEKTHAWHETKISEIDPEEAERTSEEIYRTLIKSAKDFEKAGEKRQVAKRIAESLQVEVKEFMTESVPLMLLICNPGMKERHWNDIEALTGVRIPKGETLTINMMLELGLQHHCKAIEDICISASKEYGLQLAMEKMENEWKEMIFDTKEYRQTGTRILTSIDEIQQLLDDQIVKTQAMKGSRFIKPFLEQITKWEETLTSMQDILDNWLKVQSTWLYLVSSPLSYVGLMLCADSSVQSDLSRSTAQHANSLFLLLSSFYRNPSSAPRTSCARCPRRERCSAPWTTPGALAWPRPSQSRAASRSRAGRASSTP
jgi:hypothetical protein